jgi:glyoxylase I family protein
VADLERSVSFYRDLLGLREHMRFNFGRERLAFLHAGGGWIELIEDRAAPPPTGVVDHIALRVDDLHALVARLRSASVHMLDNAPIVVPELPARIQFCVGPDGERIELIERG